MTAEPSPRPPLKLVGCPDCEKLERKIEELEGKLAASKEMTVQERTKAKALKAQLDEKQKSHADYSTVEQLFLMWCKESGRDRSVLDSKRIQTGLQRLKQFTPRELACAVRGGCRNGFTDPKSKVAYNQFSRLLANADAVEMNIERYERWCEEHGVRFDRGPSLAEWKAQKKRDDMSAVRGRSDNSVHDGSSRPEG